MAIDTSNEKFALIGWLQPWSANIPVSISSIGSGEKKQFVWEYPGLEWIFPKSVALMKNRMWNAITYQGITIDKTTTVKTVMYNNVVFQGVRFEDI